MEVVFVDIRSRGGAGVGAEVDGVSKGITPISFSKHGCMLEGSSLILDLYMTNMTLLLY